MKSALDSGSSSLGSSPRRDHYTVLGQDTLFSKASLHAGVRMITGKFNPGRGNPAMDNNPIQGELRYS